MLRTIVRYCCNESEIEYAMIRRSVRQAEEYLSKSTYDFTFPIYVSEGSQTLYKDQPFIPVVQAPRVMLLVRDDDHVSKTHQLATTILSAWPFLTFILSAACFAGIVIWLLVSSTHFTW